MDAIQWPEGKKCAVMFSFDLDGDTTWENGNRAFPTGNNTLSPCPWGSMDQALRGQDPGQAGPVWGKGNLFYSRSYGAAVYRRW